jgi:uncharacterized protein (TIGR03437 family)
LLRTYRLLPLVCAFAAAAQPAEFISGQAARAVIGQLNFTLGSATPSQYQTGAVGGLAFANGTLYVADSSPLGASPEDFAGTSGAEPITIYNRVLFFNTNNIPSPYAASINSTNPGCGLCGYYAFNVLGEPNYTTIAPDYPVPSGQTYGTPTASNLRVASGVASDGHILVVADTNNNRVLIWTTIPTTIDAPANIELGQANFTQNVANAPNGSPTSSSLLGPQGVWIQNGKLFVADTINNRVLIWNTIPTSNNQPADLVLGQSNFTSAKAPSDPLNATPAANQLYLPTSVTSDGTHLFIADSGFNRVLIWNSIPTSMDQPADVVIGQPLMTTAVANWSSHFCQSTGTDTNGNPIYPVDCAGTLSTPSFALADNHGRLYVADLGNDRVLIYNTIPTQNGASADVVLGQPNFTTNVISVQSNTLASTSIDNTSAVDITPSPTSLAWDGTNLYVSDPLNLRVLVFTPADTALPDNSVVNWASEIIRQQGIITMTGTPVASDTITVTIQSATYTYTETKTDTLDTVAQGVVAAINKGSGDPNVTALFAGTGTGSVYLSSKQADLPFDAISFSVTSSNTADIVPAVSGTYLSAGTAATGAPGMLVEINGTNLAAQSAPIVAPLTGPIPTTLAGVQVFTDGIAAPIYRASNTQIVTQIPFSFTDRNSTSIYVRSAFPDGTVKVTNATPVYIAPANPGLFATPATPGQSPVLRPAAGAFHQSGNPETAVSVDGTVTAGNTATININGRSYTYTVQSSDSLTSIAEALINAINTPGDPQVTASLGAAFTRVVLVAKQPGAAGNGIPVSTSVSSSATVALTAENATTCCDVTPGSAITTANPAVPGETINVSATGLGYVTDASNTAQNFTVAGQAYNGPQPNNAVNSVSATINGTTAEVINAGFPTGSYSIYQVQLIVPSSLSANSLSQLYIAQNAFVSNIVTLAVGSAGQASSGSTSPNSVINSGITFTATPNPIPPTSSGVGTTSLAWAGAPGTVAVYQGNPSAGGNQIALGFSSGTDANVKNVPDGTTFYLQDYTNPNPKSLTATLATVTVHVMTGVTVAIDSPNPKSAAFSGTAHFGGWVLDTLANIANVVVRIDGQVVGNALYGGARPDACAHTTAPDCPNVGWNFYYDTTPLGNGTHTLQVTGQAVGGEQFSQAASFTVFNSISTATSTNAAIDTPGPHSGAVQGSIYISGWAVNPNATISTVALSIDGAPIGNAIYGTARADVCNAFPNSQGCPNVGWYFLLDTNTLGNGTHTLQAVATAANGQVAAVSSTFTVANWTTANPMHISIGTPNPHGGPYSGTDVLFGGYAVDDVAAISSVSIAIDGISYGNAAYGISRPDVCNVYPGRPGCPNVGWGIGIDTTLLADGPHTLAVTGSDTLGRSSTSSATFSVANLDLANPMHITIDRPAKSSPAFSGIASFGGWAVANNGSITSVEMLIDGVSYGFAQYGGSRPDVCAAYPQSGGCPNVGWNFDFDTTRIYNGSHILEARATSSAGEHATTSAAFTVSNSGAGNPIHISIDVPNGNSNPFLGLAEFSGWALDQNASIATVAISIDGVPYANAQYGISRPEVCNGFPGVPGCPDVGWSLQVDTTRLADGVHTIGVTATATSGAYAVVAFVFSVANWSTGDPTKIAIDSPSPTISSYFGIVDFGGWALDPYSAVASVQVAIDGFPLGAATYGGNRQDACNAYGNNPPPGCPDVGWNLPVDTTQYSNGTHTLAVTAITTNGQSSTATATFNLEN